MPKVTEAHLEARRQQVLDAAALCFARNGFHQTSMHDICREAGLSTGAVYRYFSAKEEIIAAMSEADRRRTLALIEAARGPGPTRELLAGMAEVLLPMVLEPNGPANISLLVQLWAEAQRNPRVMDLLRHGVGEVEAVFARIIRTAQDQGEVNAALDPDAVARVLIALGHGLLFRASLASSTEAARDVAAVKAMISGLFCGPFPSPVSALHPPRQARHRT